MRNLILLALIAVSTQPSHAGTYVKNLWTQNELVACFGKAEVEKEKVNLGGYKLTIKDWNEENKQKIKQWVNEEYTAERTGIHFTGWEDCEKLPNADVIVLFNKNSKIKSVFFGGLQGIASNIGPAAGVVPGYPLARSSATISKSGMNKGVTLHEFGHVAGLAHEHVHPEASLKENRQFSCGDTKPTTTPGYVYEPFDGNSIMSYCAIRNNKLSAHDVELLKRLYP